MFFFRDLVLSSLFICLFLHPLKAMDEESEVNYPIKKINSLQKVKEKIEKLLDKNKGLSPKSICVVLDFHGVLVNEPFHQEKLTLKEDTIEILEYLKNKGISYLVATAWTPFQDVIKDGIVALKLQDFFSVKPDHVAELEDFQLGRGKVDLKGYRNGRVVALKHAGSFKKYFHQKAYAIELCYPDTKISYILFADDSEENVEQFEEDTNNILQTAQVNFVGLFLYLFQNPK